MLSTSGSRRCCPGARQVDDSPAPSPGCADLYRERGLHLAWLAAGVRPLAHDLHAAQSLVADERTPVIIGRSPGQTGDAPAGRELLRRLGPVSGGPALIMDRADHGNETRQLARDLGYRPVVPPPSYGNPAWTYDREFFRRRNEVERCCCRLKRFRRIATRYAPPATTNSTSSSSASSISP